MGKNIVLIQGHPDKSPERLCRVLANAYTQAARRAGHTLTQLDVAALNLPPLSSNAEFVDQAPSETARQAQQAIQQADHLVIIYPLWLGTLPAALKAFFEQVFRYGFALGLGPDDKFPKKLLKGRSARVIVTMGMPAIAYRLMFGAHSLKNLKRGILGMSGIKPVKTTLIGGVDHLGSTGVQKWCDRMAALGARGD